MDEELLKQQFVANLKIGLSAVESGGDYKAKNKSKKPSTASGKYQFTDYWLKPRKGNKVDSIQTYVKKHAKTFGITKNPQNFTLDDFRNNSELQDAYFNYYALNHLYPISKKLYSGENPANLPIEAIGALVHFKGESNTGRDHKKYDGHNTGAAYQVRTGDFDKEEKDQNMSSLDYVKGVLNRIETQANAQLIDENEIVKNGIVEISKEKKESVLKEFEDRNKAINETPGLTKAQRELKRKQLHQEFYDNGKYAIVNAEHAKKIEAKNKKYEDFKQGTTGSSYLSNLIQKNKDNFKKTDKGFVFEIKGRSKEENKTILKKLKERLPKDIYSKIKTAHDKIDYFGKSGGPLQKIVIEGNNSIKFLDFAEKDYRDLTGKNIYLDVDRSSDGSFNETSLEVLENFGDYNFNPQSTNELLINPKNLNKKPKSETIKNLPNEKNSNDNSNDSANNSNDVSNSNSSAKTDKNQEGAENLYLADRINAEMAAADITPNNLNYSKTKGELPLEAAAGLTLGLIGSRKANDVELPEFEAQITPAVKNFINELAERKVEGLSPEEELAANNALAEAYATSLENLKNTSSGSKSAILGNMGAISAQHQKGKLAIQLEDFRAKERAMEMYGRAIQYIDQVKQNENRVNFKTSLGDAQRNQLNAEQLAAGGFKKFIEGVENSRMKAPGSAYDMQRSYLMQTLFGYDPKMKDNGLGDTPGTYSYKMAQKRNLDAIKEKAQQTQKLYQGLTPEQKKVANKFYKTNEDLEENRKFMQTLASNQDLDLMSFDPGNVTNPEDHLSYFKTKKSNQNNLAEPKPEESNTIWLTDEEVGLNNTSNINQESTAFANPLIVNPEEEQLIYPQPKDNN